MDARQAASDRTTAAPARVDIAARAGGGWMARWGRLLALGVVLALAGAGCSIRRMAISKVGDALAGSGTTFAAEDDPELVKAAVPFSLKLMESLLAEVPRHPGLLLATASGFTQYSYAFVEPDADILEATDLAAASAVRERARRLYLRARDYGLRGLEVAHRGFGEALRRDPEAACRRANRDDVPLLYWTAAAWGSAIALSKDDPHRIAEIPQMEALIDRALELNEAWNAGAIHGFLITYEMSRQGIPGDAAARARQHFERALVLSGGRQVAPYLAFAESVCVQRQQLAEFDALLNQALAIDADAHPEVRLVNLILQRRARWLQAHRDELFLIPESEPSN